MWFFRRNGNAALAKRVQELEQRYGELLKHVASHREELEELAYKHEKLRGKFYGEKRHKTDEAEESGSAIPKTQMSRDQLKRWLTQSGRFIPGRPAIHSKE